AIHSIFDSAKYTCPKIGIAGPPLFLRPSTRTFLTYRCFFTQQRIHDFGHGAMVIQPFAAIARILDALQVVRESVAVHSEQQLKTRLWNPMRSAYKEYVSFTIMHLDSTAREDVIKATRLIRHAGQTRQLSPLGFSGTAKFVFDQTNAAGQFV